MQVDWVGRRNISRPNHHIHICSPARSPKCRVHSVGPAGSAHHKNVTCMLLLVPLLVLRLPSLLWRRSTWHLSLPWVERRYTVEQR